MHIDAQEAVSRLNTWKEGKTFVAVEGVRVSCGPEALAGRLGQVVWARDMPEIVAHGHFSYLIPGCHSVSYFRW